MERGMNRFIPLFFFLRKGITMSEFEINGTLSTLTIIDTKKKREARYRRIECDPSLFLDIFVRPYIASSIENKIIINELQGIPLDADFHAFCYDALNDKIVVRIWSSQFPKLAEGESIPLQPLSVTKKEYQIKDSQSPLLDSFPYSFYAINEQYPHKSFPLYSDCGQSLSRKVNKYLREKDISCRFLIFQIFHNNKDENGVAREGLAYIISKDNIYNVSKMV
jgi:hypothetical protein